MRLLSLEIIIMRNAELFFSYIPSVVLPADGILGQLILLHVSLPLVQMLCLVLTEVIVLCYTWSHQAAKLHLFITLRNISNFKIFWFCSDSFNEKLAWLKYTCKFSSAQNDEDKLHWSTEPILVKLVFPRTLFASFYAHKSTKNLEQFAIFNVN